MIMPMSQVKEGKIVEVKAISIKESVRKRLGELGIVSGNKIKIVKNDGRNLIVAIDESRFALDQDIARNIMIAI